MLEGGSLEGKSMVWKSVAAMEHHENLSLESLEHSDARLVARDGAGFGAIGSFAQSLSPQLLGIFLFAQQITAATAASAQDALSNSLWGHFNLIGLIAAFGTNAATKSLTYAGLNDSSFYLTGHIGPGSLSVAAMLFEATEFRMARLFALGGTGDIYKLVGLDCPDGLRYVGLKSFTDCSVANAVGAAIVREHDSLWENEREKVTKNMSNASQKTEDGKNKDQNKAEHVSQKKSGKKKSIVEEPKRDIERAWEKITTPVGRDAGRIVKVIALKITKAPKIEENLVSLTNNDEETFFLSGWWQFLLTLILIVCCLDYTLWFNDRWILCGTVAMMFAVVGLTVCFVFNIYDKRKRAFFSSGWLPFLLTLLVIISCFHYKQWFVGGLILWGTLAMMMAVVGLRVCFVFKYSIFTPPKDAPKGDCVVIDDKYPDILHVITAEEASIQALFQRKVSYEATLGKKLLFVAGGMLYIYVICSVLVLPGLSNVTGKIHFTIANVIGLAADMFKASRNGKLGLAKRAKEQFSIEYQGKVEFLNRNAAVAFLAKNASSRKMLKSKRLIPCDGPVWEKWWEELEKERGGDQIANVENPQLLESLLKNMKEGLRVPLPDEYA